VIRSTLTRTLNSISLYNSTIEGSFCESQGGTLYLENDGVTVNITRSRVSNTTAKSLAGGFIQIVKGLKLILD